VNEYRNGPLTDEWDVFVEYCEENDIDPASKQAEGLWENWPEAVRWDEF